MDKILKIGGLIQDVVGYVLEVLKIIKKRKENQ